MTNEMNQGLCDWERDHLQRMAEHHRRQAMEIAMALPEDGPRAAAILSDAARLHKVIHDHSTSAISGDVASKLAKD